VDSFLNHDYTDEDEKDEFKVSLFHLIHLHQCNHGSETNPQYYIMKYLFSKHSLLTYDSISIFIPNKTFLYNYNRI